MDELIKMDLFTLDMLFSFILKKEKKKIKNTARYKTQISLCDSFFPPVPR